MDEKRKYARHRCNLKAKFEYFEIGDGDIRSLDEHKSQKSNGTILDISRDGFLITTDSKLSINTQVIVTFKMKKKTFECKGRVVRTGFWENNPSKIAKKYLNIANLAELYIAIQFEELLEEFEDGDL